MPHFQEGQYENLQGAVVHFKSDDPALVVGPCKFTEAIQPMAASGQLLGLRHEILIQEDDTEVVHIIPYANVQRVEQSPSRVARAN